MAQKETINVGDSKIEVAPEERSPLVELLLEALHKLQIENEKLKEEINRLKGLPDPPKRPLQPSPLNDPHGKPSENKDPKNNSTSSQPDGKRAGSEKRQKTKSLTIHETVVLELDDLPEGSRRHGFEDYYVQDLVIRAHNIRYRRARYQLPDGSWITAPLPEEVRSHFGPTLQSYVLYQHHHNQVTQPLLHEELREFGVDISSGQIDRLLTEGHDGFHQEKDSLLPAARQVSSYLQTDDTSARHRGKNSHTLHIGNDWFASFSTTASKSRVNFLEVLRQPYHDYLVGGDALFYMEHHGLPQYLLRRLTEGIDVERHEHWVFSSLEEWQAQLKKWEITSPEHVRVATEGALFGSLLGHNLYGEIALISDDAKQFKILGFLHGLCWVHSERHVARLLPLIARHRRAQERVRDEIWEYYQRLKAYRASPTEEEKARLEEEFDRIFLQKTGYPDLNEVLQRIHAKRENLLLVLEHPEIPLHNNLSENDIRQYVKKRKISAGTRSDLGLRCRDTFMSLKTTCRKLGHSFWQYLQDRIFGKNQIPPLSDVLKVQASQTTNV